MSARYSSSSATVSHHMAATFRQAERAAAVGRASILQAIAIVLGLGAVGLLAATWRLLSLLGAHAA